MEDKEEYLYLLDKLDNLTAVLCGYCKGAQDGTRNVSDLKNLSENIAILVKELYKFL